MTYSIALKLFRLTFVLLIITLPAVIASAQSRESAGAVAPSRTEARTSADETFELNIAERHIVEQNFSASTSVETGEESARGLRLRVGVGIGAEEIDVRLRNVRGSVRFRATLEPVLRLLDARRAAAPSP